MQKQIKVLDGLIAEVEVERAKTGLTALQAAQLGVAISALKTARDALIWQAEAAQTQTAPPA